MNKYSKYPKPMIAIHWLTVLVLITVSILGISMEEYEFNEANFNHYRIHAIVGMFLLILTLIRLYFRKKFKNKLPKEINYYSNTHKFIVKLVVKLLYFFLILTPILGFLMIYQTGAMQADFGGAFPEGAEMNETLELLHKISIFFLVSLSVVHLAGVIIYKFKSGENIVMKMCIRGDQEKECE